MEQYRRRHRTHRLFIIRPETIRPGGEVAMKATSTASSAGLGAQDRVALMTAPYRRLKWTSRRSMPASAGRWPPSRAGLRVETASDARAATAPCSSRFAARWTTCAEARRRCVVLFTGQMSVPPGVVSLRTSGDRARQVARVFQARELVGRGAPRAVLHHPADLAVVESNRAGLEHLSGVTAAPCCIWRRGGLGADPSGARTSGYYIAAVEPEPSETTGALRGLAISVPGRAPSCGTPAVEHPAAQPICEQKRAHAAGHDERGAAVPRLPLRGH